MRHNKIRNPGIILELLNRKLSEHTVVGDVEGGKKIFQIIKEFFMNSDSYLREVYDRVYSPILYGETRNHYYAARFLDYILTEYESIDQDKLNKVINELLEQLDSVTNRKVLFDNKIHNYKLHASIKCLGDNKAKKIPLTAKEKIQCEQKIMEHMLDNTEIKRLKESSKTLKTYKTEDQVIEDQLAMAIALKMFKKKYKGVLSDDQNQFLLKYLTTPSTKSFNRWVEKKLKSLVSEIDNKRDSVDGELQEKLDLARNKFQSLLQLESYSSENMIDILLSFELCNTLKLF